MTIPSKLGGQWTISADSDRQNGFAWSATHDRVIDGTSPKSGTLGLRYAQVAAHELEELYVEIEIWESERMTANETRMERELLAGVA